MTLWYAEERSTEPNYRIRVAQMLPALQLCYFVLLWPLIYARNIPTADLTTGPAVELQPFLLNRLFFPAIAAIAILIFIAERHKLSRFHPVGLALFAGLFAYLGLAVSWALVPSTSLSKVILLALQIASIVPAALMAHRVEDVVRPMFWVMAATLVTNMLAVGVIAPTPIGFAGIYSHKNTLGAIAALGGLFALYGITRQGEGRVRAMGFFMLAAALALLLLSRSKTSTGLFLACPALALCAVFARRYLRIALPILIVVTAIPAVFLLSGAVDGISYHNVSTLISSDGTFTGRTELWDFALLKISERPWLGYGYQSFWGIGAASPAATTEGFLQRAPHAHNGYLDLMLQGGVILLLIFSLQLLLTAWWIDRLTDRDPGLGFFATATLLYLLLLNLLETDWLQGLSGTSMMSTLLFLLAATERKGRLLS